MRYLEHAPSAALSGIIDCYWSVELDDTARGTGASRILPDGCADIIFDFDSAGARSQLTGALIVGAMTTAALVTPAAPQSLGVRFLPGGAARLFGFPLSEITDATEPLADACNVLCDVAQRVADAYDMMARIDVLEAFITRSCVDADAGERSVRSAWHMMDGGGGPTSIREFAHMLGLSERTLERSFRYHAGITPKQAMRVARLRRAIHRMRCAGGRDLGRIALEAGYYDQPHFCHEFRSLAGVSPEEYRSTLV